MNRTIVIMATIISIMLVIPLSTVAELGESDPQTAEIKSFTTLELTKEELDEQELSKIEEIFKFYDTADDSFGCSQTIFQNQPLGFSVKSTELSLGNVSVGETGPNIKIVFQGTAFFGRYGIKMFIENIGDETAYDITWTISVSSGPSGPINKEFSEHILIIEPGDGITIHTRRFFGVGAIIIKAELDGENIDNICKFITGTQKFFRTVL